MDVAQKTVTIDATLPESPPHGINLVGNELSEGLTALLKPA